MDDQTRALKWRAGHRGTREADMMIGGYFDAHHEQWGPPEREWFGNDGGYHLGSSSRNIVRMPRLTKNTTRRGFASCI